MHVHACKKANLAFCEAIFILTLQCQLMWNALKPHEIYNASLIKMVSLRHCAKLHIFIDTCASSRWLASGCMNSPSIIAGAQVYLLRCARARPHNAAESRRHRRARAITRQHIAIIITTWQRAKVEGYPCVIQSHYISEESARISIAHLDRDALARSWSWFSFSRSRLSSVDDESVG